MRQCKCGGVIRQHELTGNREAWTCNECGRYEIIKEEKKWTYSKRDSTDFGQHGLKAPAKVASQSA